MKRKRNTPSSSKRPLRMRLADLQELRASLERNMQLHQRQESTAVQEALTDTLTFLQRYCKLKPYWYLLDLVKTYETSQFIAVRCPRQTGKSTCIAALLLAEAWQNPDFHIAFIGPSWRQTKRNITIASRFCHNLPQKGLHVQKTKITLPNGSIIEAFPNNPDTIRGNTLHRVWWDETNFTPDDTQLYDSIIFALSTTNGKLTASSTPFNTDSLFWKMCNHKDYEEFTRLHFSYEKAIEPEGPLKKDFIAKMVRQFGEDQARWRREMEAEWAQDEDVWLPQSLIASCIGTIKNCGEDLQLWDEDKGYQGDLFAGLDLAQVRDYSVFCVLQRSNDKLLLRHLKIFKQPTNYATVLGYIKMLQDRWDGFQKIRVDYTKEGPSFISEMEAAGIKNAEGVTFSIPRKSEIANLLMQRMRNGQFFYPNITMEKPYRSDLCNELNIERYEHRRDGTLALNPPSGTHDDVFWSIALGVYATVDMKEFDLEALHFG